MSPLFGLILVAAITAAPDSKAESKVQCGGYCLYVGLRALDVALPEYPEFAKGLGPPTAQGYSMEQLAEGAKQRGLLTLGVHTTLERLEVRSPRLFCIALLKDGHFVLLGDTNADKVTIVDPPRVQSLSRPGFEYLWTGDVLLVSDKPLAEEETLRVTKTSFPWLWAGLGLAGAVLVAVLLVVSRRTRPATLMLALTLGLVTGCGRAAAGQGQLIFTTSHSELGTLNAGEVRTIRFPIQNNGKAPLRISELESSCACAQTDLTCNPIPPGGRGELLITVRDDGSGGGRSAGVNLYCNDPDMPRTMFTVAWESVSFLQFRPTTLDFGRIRPGAQSEREVVLLGAAEHIKSLRPVPSPGHEVVRTEPIPGGLKLRVRLTGGSEEGTHNGQLVFRHEKLQRALIVSHEIAPAVSAVPKSLLIPTDNGDISPLRVTLFLNDPGEIELDRVDSSSLPDGSEVTIVTAAERALILEVKSALPAERGVFGRELHVYFKQPAGVHVVIPVSGIVP